MSDEEDIRSEEEEEGEEEEEAAPAPVHREEDTGPTEAQVAMQQRRQVTTSSSGLDDESKEMLELNKEERGRMEEEIDELRMRTERRKAERAEEEKLLVVRRREEDAKRKADEEERRKKKDDEEKSKRDARAAKMMEFEKWKNPPIPNFVISKKERTGGDEEEEEEVDPEKERKSKEQLEAEKRAILSQRITKLDTSGFDNNKLAEKAKELHNQLYRLESEKYDLEKRFKCQQYDMMELAERARQMNKVGKQGSIKRIQLQEDESDKIQDRFAGCPAKIKMFSDADRKKDIRTFGQRQELYRGPVYASPTERISQNRTVIWNEEGLPSYLPCDDDATQAAAPPEQEPMAEPAPEEVKAEA